MSRNFTRHFVVAVLLLLNLAYFWAVVPRSIFSENSRLCTDANQDEMSNGAPETKEQVVLANPPTQPPIQIPGEQAFQPLEGIDKIFVISLKSRPDRRAHMERMLKHHNLQVEWWDAQTPDSYLVKMYLDSSRMADEEREHHMRKLEMSCYASHVSIYMEIVRRGYKNALILEDDIDIDMDMRSMWADRLDAIKTHSWDMLFLGYCAQTKLSNIKGWNLPKSIGCTHAYIINSEFAAKFLGTSNHTLKPIDLELADFCTSVKCRAYLANQLLVAQLPRDADRNPSALEANWLIPGQFVLRSTAKL